eukprot:7029200-Karenia_brevis.AAC.1
MGDWNNLPKGEVLHYVDPLKQGECTAKCHNPVKGKCRSDPGFDDTEVRRMMGHPRLTLMNRK